MTATPGVEETVRVEVDGASGRRTLVERAAGPQEIGLRKKATALLRLSGDARFPAVIRLTERDGWTELVLDDSDVLRTLAEEVEQRTVEGRLPGAGELTAVTYELAQMLAVLAREGLVCAGLHPGSIGVVAGGQWRLWALAPSGAAPSVGTADVAALLLHVATGAPPGAAPRLARLGTGLTAINPRLTGPLADVLVEGLTARPDGGEPRAFADRLAAAGRMAGPSAPAGAPHAPDFAAIVPPLAARVARSLAGSWAARRRGLHDGPEGELLALVQAAPLVGLGPDVVSDAAERLMRSPLPGESAGLHWGTAGVALALIQAGQTLTDAAFVTAAEALADSLVSQPFNGPDLMKGAAGRLFLHLAVWRETSAQHQLEAAQAAGAWLVEHAQPAEVGRGWPSERGHVYVGWAHGAAGVGAALGTLALATGDDRWGTAAADAWRLVYHQARPVLDGRGRAWPELVGGMASSPRWCHGAGGILRFGLVAEALGFDGAADIVTRGAAACAETARGAGPSRCHGLSGLVEVLADVCAATGGGTELTGAQALADILVSFADHEGRFLPDPPTRPRTGLLLGDAGVLHALSRLWAVSRPDVPTAPPADRPVVFW